MISVLRFQKKNQPQTTTMIATTTTTTTTTTRDDINHNMTQVYKKASPTNRKSHLIAILFYSRKRKMLRHALKWELLEGSSFGMIYEKLFTLMDRDLVRLN